MVDNISENRWIDLFKSFEDAPVLWEARRQIVESLAARPDQTVSTALELLHLGDGIDAWQGTVEQHVGDAAPMQNKPNFHRYLMGQLMKDLRGRVVARDVSEELSKWINRKTS